MPATASYPARYRSTASSTAARSPVASRSSSSPPRDRDPEPRIHPRRGRVEPPPPRQLDHRLDPRLDHVVEQRARAHPALAATTA